MNSSIPALDVKYRWRNATPDDAGQLEELLNVAIERLLSPYLNASEVAASFSVMGLDRRLLEDGTYFVVEWKDRIIASGGWSGRATLFGGDHSAGRDASPLNPDTDPARVRAMYTHPEFTRQGLGRFVLALSEHAARGHGFRHVTLVATMAGLPLYRACGYREAEHFREMTPSGVSVPLVRMEKSIAGLEL